MYNHFKGLLVEKNPSYALIECNGVGFYLNISLQTYTQLPEIGAPAMLLAHLSIKEDAHTLFGFYSEAERSLFRMLISVSGVGASTARIILSSVSINDLQRILTLGDAVSLKAIKGIGEKTAQRIVVDLRGKLDKENMSATQFMSAHNSLRSEALTALTLLGFPRSAAEKALDKVLVSGQAADRVEEVIRRCLKIL